MTLIEAIDASGIAEANFDNYTVVVREEENERAQTALSVSISRGGMPPHFQRDFSTVEEAETYLANETFLPVALEWEPVDGE